MKNRLQMINVVVMVHDTTTNIYTFHLILLLDVDPLQLVFFNNKADTPVTTICISLHSEINESTNEY